MALRIACDIDGTLADMDAALQREADLLFGAQLDVRLRPSLDRTAEPPADVPPEALGASAGPPGAGPPDPPRRRAPSTEEWRALWTHVRGIDNFWSTLPEIEPGSVARFARAAADRRWEVLFVTQRPPTAGDIAQVQTQRWLASLGYDLPSVYVIGGSRGLAAAALALDVLVDDRPENCVDLVSDSDARAVLLWRHDPARVPPGAAGDRVTVVASFGQAIEVLGALDDARRRPGLLGRLRSKLRA